MELPAMTGLPFDSDGPSCVCQQGNLLYNNASRLPRTHLTDDDPCRIELVARASACAVATRDPGAVSARP